MKSIQEAIIVEGRYDKNTLLQLYDALIIETGGFGIFNDSKKQEYIRLVAEKRGVIIFTDSDGAGLVIRNFLKGILPQKRVIHAYVPEIPGKERRKRQASCEGILGVEGMTPEIIEQSLLRAGVHISECSEQIRRGAVTKTDLMRLGLSGASNSAELRKIIMKKLGFPTNLSSNAFLDALNAMTTYEELKKLVDGVNNDRVRKS